LENQLEQLLAAAVQDPGRRPDFYRALLESDLYVLGTTHRDEGEFTAGEDTRMEVHVLEVDGRPVIPIFSSVTRIQEFIDREETYLRMNGRALLSTVAGSGTGLVLNPGSAYGKEFTPAEIVALVDGSIFRQGQAWTAEGGEQVLLSQPAEYPHELVRALQSFFADRPVVRAAYLAQMHMPSSGDPPHVVIGVVAGGDLSSIAGEVGLIAREVLGEGEFVDLIPIGQGPISEYMIAQTEPFYVRGGNTPHQEQLDA
jgi:hypothetical protein